MRKDTQSFNAKIETLRSKLVTSIHESEGSHDKGHKRDENPDSYIDWEMKVEQNLKCFNFNEMTKMRLVVIEFCGKRNGEVESESSQEDPSSSSEEKSSSDSFQYKGDLLIVRKLMCTLIGEKIKSQTENIFHSRYLVLGKLCSFIIDGGSSVNVASLRLVKKLALHTLPQLKPYKLYCLSEG
ncbi:hypothetical protein CR513_59395, partial [Mucuna pruriens]